MSKKKIDKKCKEGFFQDCINDKKNCWPYPESCGINPYLLRKVTTKVTRTRTKNME